MPLDQSALNGETCKLAVSQTLEKSKVHQISILAYTFCMLHNHVKSGLIEGVTPQRDAIEVADKCIQFARKLSDSLVAE
jgi:hypothetical protein